MKKLIDSIKYLKLADFFAPLIFILILPFSIIYKIYNKTRKKNIWLICESGTTARDNGYYFFKYIRDKYPTDSCFYVMDKRSDDYDRVKKFGNIIQFKSLKHWLYYLSAKYNISTQKSGNPNQPFFYLIHVVFGWFNNRIFLQHGITINDSKWLYYKNTKFRLFICGAKKEYEFIKEKFGYPKDNVAFTGFARFDTLKNESDKNQILIMPSWRNWLGRETNILGEKVNFVDTEYYKKWNSVLNNQRLIDKLKEKNVNMIFRPHINMMKYIDLFNSSCNNIIISKDDTQIQTLLKTSKLLITDYSSVAMDFSYMKKPVIYYQFDKEEFRKKQYQLGYFNYDNDGFGDVIVDNNQVVNKIIWYIDNSYELEGRYFNKIDEFFNADYTNNCEKIYNAILKI